MRETQSITILDQATRMLAEVRSIDEAMQLIDLAEAARVYARQVGLGLEAQNHAAEIKLRAQRRAGEILREMEKAKGNAGTMNGKDVSGGYIMQPPEDDEPTYAELGIDKRDAHVWQKIASLPEENFDDLVQIFKAEFKELTTAAIYRIARFEEAKIQKTEPAPLSGKYSVIYADPPWQYGDRLVEGYAPAEYHYPTMSIEALCALPVRELAEEQAVLFLWVTSPLLEECFQVIGAWGFEYKTSFVWDKVRHNYGHYNSVRHELLLVCTRGSFIPQVNRLFDSVQSIERTEHSAKPEEFRQMIDTLYPYGKRIELFARKRAENWEVWGNEAATT